MKNPIGNVLANVLACALSCAAAAHANAQPGPPAANVEVATATSAEFAPVLWVPGGVVSRDDARVANELAGRLTAVAEVGERVRKGGVLARVDDAMLRLRAAEGEASIARIEAQLDYATAQEGRLAELVQRASVSGAQLDEARSQRRVLEQDLRAARVALEQVRLQLRQATVVAPFDGLVAERFVQAGEYLAIGQPVLRLVSTTALEVRARAPVGLAGELRVGMPVAVRGDEVLLEQRMRAVVPVGDEASRQFEVRIDLQSSGLAIGTPVQVGLPSAAPRTVVAVPRDALLLRKEGTYVVRVEDAGTAARIPVEVGSAQEGLVEVLGEVRAGDRLVVRGGERLQPGQALTVAASATAQAANLAADIGGGMD